MISPFLKIILISYKNRSKYCFSFQTVFKRKEMIFLYKWKEENLCSDPSPTPISCIVLNVWMNAYMHKKEEREEKCYLKMMVPRVVGLNQVLLHNLNIVDYTFDDLFLIYRVTTPQVNRIMQDPNIKIIPVI